jgi:ArsR family transcriptional regulator, arsenate/arsenite/antimonite-responsive transcriptional repressor
MSNSRKTLNLETAARIFKVLGHPHRLAIFLRLCERCETTRGGEDDADAAYVGELSKGLKIAPSTVSHHLKELRQAGVITMERDGQFIECCPNLAVVEQINAFMTKHCGCC